MATNNPDGKVWQESQGRFRLLGNPQDYDCSLDIRDVRRGDSGTYVFRVERGPSVRYTYTRDQLSVRVTGKEQTVGEATGEGWGSQDNPGGAGGNACWGSEAGAGPKLEASLKAAPRTLLPIPVSPHLPPALTQTPDILISGTLESGRPSNLTCSVPWACAWGTPPIFSWTSAALTSLGPKTHLSSVLTLTPRLQDHGTDLTCQVTLPGTGVTTMRTIHLNVSCENRARATRIPDGVLRAVGWGVRAWDLGCRVLECGLGGGQEDLHPLPISAALVGTEGQCPPALSVDANLPCLSVPDSPWNLTVTVFQENGTGRIGAPPRVQGARAGLGPSCGSPRGPPPPRPPWPREQLSPSPLSPPLLPSPLLSGEQEQGDTRPAELPLIVHLRTPSPFISLPTVYLSAFKQLIYSHGHVFITPSKVGLRCPVPSRKVSRVQRLL